MFWVMYIISIVIGALLLLYGPIKLGGLDSIGYPFAAGLGLIVFGLLSALAIRQEWSWYINNLIMRRWIHTTDGIAGVKRYKYVLGYICSVLGLYILLSI